MKCHQYWPDLYETMDYGHLQVTCLKEEQSASFAFREFTLVNIEVCSTWFSLSRQSNLDDAWLHGGFFR